MVLSFGQKEQGVHKIKKSLIYSIRKAFLEHAVLELVYTRSLLRVFEKVSQSLKCHSNLLEGEGGGGGGHTCIYLMHT